jgi:V/A-type H+/Na+-transporting ATPase subunit I
VDLPEGASPVRMCRVAVVALRSRVRDVLVALADAGCVDLSGPLGGAPGPALEALRRLDRRDRPARLGATALARETPDIRELEERDARELLAGEVELERRRESAVDHGSFALFVGWVPRPALSELGAHLQASGASLVELGAPRWVEPPTLLVPAPAADSFRPLLDMYGTVPYADVDPTPFVAVTYCLMFGMMFGDVGDGLVVLLAALALRRARHPRLQPLRRVWRMIAALGGTSMLFGVLYGELFGPTHVLSPLWLDPLDAPTRLIGVSLAVGGVLLAAGGVLGCVNRWREGGRRLALRDASALPGLALLVAGGVVLAGLAGGLPVAAACGAVLAAAALIPIAAAERSQAGRGVTAAAVVVIGSLDSVVRVFSNVFSFARLGAFGLMHAAIGQIVVHAAGGLTGSPAGDIAAAVVFVAGCAMAFALGALVVAVQALRLEYYELFSRVLVRTGRPFAPWSLPLLSTKEAR